MIILRNFKYLLKLPNWLKFDYFLHSFKSYHIPRIGTVYGGWRVPLDSLKTIKDCICIGCGEDISFDLALKLLFLKDVYSYDPTPKSIRYIKDNGLDKIVTFHPFGVWSCKKTLNFYLPANEEEVSLSIHNIQQSNNSVKLDCISILDCFTHINSPHQNILVKMDIEGAEPNIIHKMFTSGVKPKLLCIEFDSLVSRKKSAIKRAHSALRMLNNSGYKLLTADGTNMVFEC